MVERRLPRWSEMRELARPRPITGNATDRRLAGAATVADLREIARRRVPRAVFDYTDGAAGAEISLRRSREAFERIEFCPSVLRDVSAVDPVDPAARGALGAAPRVRAHRVHPAHAHRGRDAVGRVAERTGIPYALSTMGTTSLEALATAAPGARRWFQLYLWKDREASAALVERARVAGYEALVLTVDTPVAGPRLRDVRNGFTIPPALTVRTVANAAVHPRWWVDLLTTPPLEFASLRSWGGTVAELVDRVFEPAATVADVRALRETWSGPSWSRASRGGRRARGGRRRGRRRPRLQPRRPAAGPRPTPLEQLPAIVAAVGDRAEVYLDGGILDGADVVAAVAMGARACLVGRAYLYGLMAGGERGVQRAADILARRSRHDAAARRHVGRGADPGPGPAPPLRSLPPDLGFLGCGMDVVEIVPSFEEYAFTFGGVAPLAGSRRAPRCACGPTTRSAERCGRRRTSPARRWTCGSSIRRPGRSTSRARNPVTPWRCTSWPSNRPATGVRRGHPVLRRPDQHRPGGHAAGPAPGHDLDLRAGPRPQHGDLRGPAQRPQHRAAGGTDARHRRRRPGRGRGAQLAGARALRREHGHPQMRAGSTASSA